MAFFKSIKKTSLLISIAYIVMGVLSFVDKSTYQNYLFIILSIGLIVGGALSITRYFLIKIEERINRNDFVIGLLLVALGIICFFIKSNLSLYFNKMMAVLIIISTLVLLQDLLNLHVVGKKLDGLYLSFIIIGIALGLVIFLEPFENVTITAYILGVSLIYIGAVNIFSNFYLAIALQKYENNLKEAEKQKEVADEELLQEEKENSIDDEVPLT